MSKYRRVHRHNLRNEITIAKPPVATEQDIVEGIREGIITGDYSHLTVLAKPGEIRRVAKKYARQLSQPHRDDYITNRAQWHDRKGGSRRVNNVPARE